MPSSIPLDVHLLRKIEVRLEKPLKFPYSKVFALLAYLLLEPGRQRREVLTDLLWQQQDEDTARANLRNAVHALRRLVGQERVGSNREHVWFVPAAHDCIDTALLHAGVPEELPDAGVESLFDLVSGYTSELMSGFALPDAPGYMEWLDIKRLACHRQLLSLSEQLLQYFALAGNRTRQIALAQAQTLIDPWNESFHLRLMQLLAEDGRSASALAHFDYLGGLFRREMDSAPGPAVRALSERLRVAAQPPPALLAPPQSVAQARPMTLLYIEIRCLAAEEQTRLRFLQRARQLVGDEATRQGAHPCLTPDGGILAFFGYPGGLPNACPRALRTACNIRQQPELADVLLRFSLHQGPMQLRADPVCPDALGVMSDIVIKLASCGSPGDILATRAFTERFDTLDLAPLAPPPEFYPHGPQQAYRIANAPNAPGRRESPLVGREKERGELQQLWRSAQRGSLRAAVIGGLPGCGKSRLARWMLGTLAEASQAVVLHCRQSQSEVPFLPLAETIKRECAIHPGDSLENRRLKLARWLSRHHPQLAAAQRDMIGWLAGLPLENEEFSPAARRRCLHDALRGMLARQAGNGPLLVVMEDIHWADPSTLQFFEELLTSGAKLPCLLLFTARPPCADTWQAQLPRINPAPLTPEQGRSLVQALLAAPPDEHGMTEIIARAQGNPLYLEALAHARMAQSGLLPSLEDSILAPLAHDEGLRRIALGAAALGEEFGIELLRTLFAEESTERFHAALRALERHGLIKPVSAGQGRFHHALIRDTLYDSASFSERRQTHHLIQQAAPKILPGLAAEQPHWLARHAELAGDLPYAAELLERAAHHDLGMAAHREAVQHFRSARQLLERLPSSRANERRILRLMLGEGNATVALSGYGAAATRSVFSQVLERGNPREDRAEIFLALYGLWLGSSSHGGYEQALRDADRLQQLAEQTGDPLHRLQTAYAYGNNTLWLGELAASRNHLEAAIALYDAHPQPELLSLFHEDTGVTSLSFLAWVAWLQGDSAAADAAQARALELARRLGHPFSLGFALALAARLELLKGAVERVEALAEELQALAERQSFAVWEGVGAVMLGWVRCTRRDAGGIALMEQSLALIAHAMPSLEVTFLSMFADGLFRLGLLAECAGLLERTLERCAYWQDHYLEAELLRLRAACAAAAGDAANAAAWREAARAIAARQGARAFLERLATA